MFITSRASANMAPPLVLAMVRCECDPCDDVGLVRLALAWLPMAGSPGRSNVGIELLVYSPILRLAAYWQELRNRSEEHTSELQSLRHLVCRLLLEKKT